MSRPSFRRTLLLSTLALLLAAFPALAVTPAGEALQVNVPSPYWQISPAVAAVDDAFLVVWEDMRFGVRGRFVDAAGTPLGGELELVANTPFPDRGGRYENYVSQHAPELVGLPDGGFYLFWMEQIGTLDFSIFYASTDVDSRGIYGQRFNAAGVPVADRFRVNATAAGLQDRPEATLLSDGRVAVVWQEASTETSRDVRVEARFVDDGAPVGEDLRVSTAPASKVADPVPAPLADGGVLVAWVGFDGDGAGILARGLSAAGVFAGPPLQVNTTESRNQTSPALARGADGRVLVGWQHNVEPLVEYRIRGRFLDAAGAVVGDDDFQISTEVAKADGAPGLAALSDGGYMAFWLGWSGSTPQWIVGQQLDAAGAPVGVPVQVSDERPQPQYALETAVGDGSLFVTWEGRDGRTHGVDGRCFDVSRPVTVLSVQAAGSR